MTVRQGKSGVFCSFLVNGKSASTENGLETILEEGDVLAILPPVGGGLRISSCFSEMV